MKERPILFSGPMVRAILAGTKTQTRRVVKARKCPDYGCHMSPGEIAGDEHAERLCPHGQPGDRLWVRESFCDARQALVGRVLYRASGDTACSWTPSIHMPRSASRITLEVAGVRVQRLQDISEADALSEGIVQTRNGFGLPDGSHFHAADPRKSYWSLWEAINGPGSVMANPWVWVVVFRSTEVASHERT